MHWFYVAFRIAFEVIACAAFVVSSHQLYLDRHGLHELWRWPIKLKTHRVFRVCSCVGSFFFIVVCVDFYGTFGIYNTTQRMVLYTVAILPVPTGIGVAIYKEVVAILVFMPFDRNKARRGILVAALIHCAADYSIYVASFYVASRTLFLLSRIAVAATQVFSIVLMVYVYYTLRGHAKTMEKSGISSTSRKRWEKNLQQWRIYAFGLSSLLAIAFVTIVYDAARTNNPDTDRNNINYEVDPDAFPSTHAVGSPILFFGSYVLFTWRSFLIRKFGESTRSRSSTTDTSGSGVGSKHPPSTSAKASAKGLRRVKTRTETWNSEFMRLRAGMSSTHGHHVRGESTRLSHSRRESGFVMPSRADTATSHASDFELSAVAAGVDFDGEPSVSKGVGATEKLDDTVKGESFVDLGLFDETIKAPPRIDPETGESAETGEFAVRLADDKSERLAVNVGSPALDSDEPFVVTVVGDENDHSVRSDSEKNNAESLTMGTRGDAEVRNDVVEINT